MNLVAQIPTCWLMIKIVALRHDTLKRYIIEDLGILLYPVYCVSHYTLSMVYYNFQLGPQLIVKRVRPSPSRESCQQWGNGWAFTIRPVVLGPVDNQEYIKGRRLWWSSLKKALGLGVSLLAPYSSASFQGPTSHKPLRINWWRLRGGNEQGKLKDEWV